MASLIPKLMMWQIRKGKDTVVDFDAIEEFRENIENMMKFKVVKGVVGEEIQIGNVPAEKYTLETPHESGPFSMLYLHGGGYFSGSYKTHRGFVSLLCKKLQIEGYSINYGLAPENPFPAGLEDAFSVYKWMIEDQSIPPEQIILVGDSAGGGLVLSLLVRISNQKFVFPKAAFCMSPWTDLTLSSDSIKTKAEEEPFFNMTNMHNSADAYTNSQPATNPEISPIFGNFEGFPPILLQVGTKEILLDDTLNIAKKMESQGVKVELLVFKGMFHDFQIFAAIPVVGKIVPEFRKAIKSFKAFVDGLK